MRLLGLNLASNLAGWLMGDGVGLLLLAGCQRESSSHTLHSTRCGGGWGDMMNQLLELYEAPPTRRRGRCFENNYAQIPPPTLPLPSTCALHPLHPLHRIWLLRTPAHLRIPTPNKPPPLTLPPGPSPLIRCAPAAAACLQAPSSRRSRRRRGTPSPTPTCWAPRTRHRATRTWRTASSLTTSARSASPLPTARGAWRRVAVLWRRCWRVGRAAFFSVVP